MPEGYKRGLGPGICVSFPCCVSFYLLCLSLSFSFSQCPSQIVPYPILLPSLKKSILFLPFSFLSLSFFFLFRLHFFSAASSKKSILTRTLFQIHSVFTLFKYTSKLSTLRLNLEIFLTFDCFSPFDFIYSFQKKTQFSFTFLLLQIKRTLGKS